MFSEFDLSKLPSVPLPQLDSLPDCPAVYFAIDSENRVLYVGKAINLLARWKDHHRFEQLNKIHRKNTIKLAWMVCANDRELLAKTEIYFIEFYQPLLNKTPVPAKKITPSEIVLQLNYVAQYFISYLVTGPMMEPGAPSPFSPKLPETAQLPTILPQTQTHAGILIALIAAGIVWVVFLRSPLGYQIEAVGQNPIAARYAGMFVERTLILTMAVSGGLAGLAGASEVMGLKYRLFENFSGGYGFDAIAIALLSRGSIPGVIFISLFFGALRSGANVMQRSAGVPVTVVYAIQGLTVLFIAISFALEGKKKFAKT